MKNEIPWLSIFGAAIVAACLMASENKQPQACIDCADEQQLKRLEVDYAAVPACYAESPAMNLPIELQQENWGGGSCVHASTVMLLRWQGQYELADYWRQTYSGGEYADRLHRRMETAGLRYAYTVDGDVEFLQWCCRTRRGAAITYWPSHMVNLVHLDEQRAGLLDNNRVGRVIWIDRGEFLRNWRGYGGWATTVVYNPPPPLPTISKTSLKGRSL